MSNYVYPPKHGAVAVAAKLREEIASCMALIASKKAAHLRRANRNDEKISAVTDGLQRETLLASWAYTRQEHRLELACDEARMGELRRMLQWLTGELWS